MKVSMFEAVLRNNKHEIVAAALEQSILGGELKVGDKLPSEQNLASQFDVSRNIVREALREVRARGLIEVRNGTGSYITRPTSSDVGDMLNRLVTLSDTAVADYYEVRETLEVRACELAAARASTEDLRNLEESLAIMYKCVTERNELTQRDFEFHQIIATATKNPLLISLLQPLKSVMTSMFDISYSLAAGQEALHGHEVIIAAIRSRDSGQARAAMLAHLENSERNFTSLMKHLQKDRSSSADRSV